jgi:hypothetical protein
MEKPVDAMYCNAKVNEQLTHIILDSGSVGSVITKDFAKQIGLEISEPSRVNMIDIHGGRKRSLGKIKGVPIDIKGCIMEIDMDVTEAKEYSVLIGNDLLSKIKAVIDYQKRILTFQWKGISEYTAITCWKRPEYQKDKPVNLEITSEKQEPTPQISYEDEFEDETEELDDQPYCIIGSEEHPLVRISNSDIFIEQRQEPKTYLEEVKMCVNKELVNGKGMEQHWKGSNAICWCDKVLETINDECSSCA